MSAEISIHSIKVEVPGRGHISAEITQPSVVKAVMTLGHGAGSTMNQPFLRQLSTSLAGDGIATIRYNFLYSEAGRKMPDRFPAASAAVSAVFNEAHNQFPDVPLFAGGKSFGGRMTSMTLAETPFPFVRGVVFLGFPLHPAGSPSVERAAHLSNLTLPLLFVQGSRDELATEGLLRDVLIKLPTAKLVMFEGADHSFKGGKMATMSAITSEISNWIRSHT